MNMQAEADQLLAEAAASGRLPGVVMLVTDGEGTVYEGAAGVRSLATGVPMTTDSVFWIASMTKAITATAAMQLVEQGRLELDAPIGGLLPELAEPEVLEGFDADGTPRLRKAKGEVTLRHLLSHTSGLSYDMWNADILRYMQANDIPHIGACARKTLTMPLVFDPGTGWEYGTGIDLVGQAVERTAGMDLETYFRRHVTGPLGMTDTMFKLGDSQMARLAAIHTRAADGSYTAIPFVIPQEPEFQMGGGGLYSTAADYARFLRMLLNRGRLGDAVILRPETVEHMLENQLGEITIPPMKQAMPHLTNDVDLFAGMPKGWGLSFCLNGVDLPSGRRVGSAAWAGLANSYFWFDPASDLAGLILTQILPFADPDVLATFEAVETLAYRQHGARRAA